MPLAPGGSKTGAPLNMPPKRTELSTVKRQLDPDVIMPRMKPLSQGASGFQAHVPPISLDLCLMAPNRLLNLILFNTRRWSLELKTLPHLTLLHQSLKETPSHSLLQLSPL